MQTFLQNSQEVWGMESSGVMVPGSHPLHSTCSSSSWYFPAKHLVQGVVLLPWAVPWNLTRMEISLFFIKTHLEKLAFVRSYILNMSCYDVTLRGNLPLNTYYTSFVLPFLEPIHQGTQYRDRLLLWLELDTRHPEQFLLSIARMPSCHLLHLYIHYPVVDFIIALMHRLIKYLSYDLFN